MHICSDEIMLGLAAVPFARAFALKVHAWWRTKFPKHKTICHAHESHGQLVSSREEKEQNTSDSDVTCSGIPKT